MLLHILTFTIFSVTTAFYLPGLAPVTYCKESTEDCKSDVPVFVNRLNSVMSAIPFGYDMFDFCQPSEDAPVPDLNYGQILSGDRIRASPYKLKFMTNVQCETVCKKTYTRGNKTSLSELEFLQNAMKLNYKHNWIVDNMPVTWCYATINGGRYCSRSFPIGCYVTSEGNRKDACVLNNGFSEKDAYYFFNHLDLTIKYHPQVKEDSPDAIPNFGRIISANVELQSHAYDATATGRNICWGPNVMGMKGGSLDDDVTIRYTYSVKWEKELNIKWSSRWHYILETGPTNINWFSLINSLVVILFLTLFVVRICLQTMRKKAVAYDNLANSFSLVPDKIAKEAEVNEQENKPFIAKNKRWKLVMGDVFRPPSCGLLLSSLVGSGVQIFFTAFITLVFASLGFLSPANPGALMMCGVISFVCMGLPAGYMSARIYKRFGGERKFLATALTSFFCPGLVFAMFLMLNAVLAKEGSSSAMTYPTILKLLAVWIGASGSLTFLGAYIGFKKAMLIEESFNENPRQIPKRALLVLPAVSFFGGILPFGCIFIQLYFILTSLWAHQAYNMFGLLFLMFLCLVITCLETIIVFCFYQLVAEDYRWWWKSFLSSGFTAVCVYIYCIHYYTTKLELEGWASKVIYFGYMLVVVFLIFLMTGSLGFYACYWFVAKLYKNHQLSATSDHIKPSVDNEYDNTVVPVKDSPENPGDFTKPSLDNPGDFTKPSLDNTSDKSSLDDTFSSSKQNLLQC